jgi:hypothetical protein
MVRAGTTRTLSLSERLGKAEEGEMAGVVCFRGSCTLREWEQERANLVGARLANRAVVVSSLLLSTWMAMDQAQLAVQIASACAFALNPSTTAPQQQRHEAYLFLQQVKDASGDTWQACLNLFLEEDQQVGGKKWRAEERMFGVQVVGERYVEACRRCGSLWSFFGDGQEDWVWQREACGRAGVGGSLSDFKAEIIKAESVAVAVGEDWLGVGSSHSTRRLVALPRRVTRQ